MQGRATKKLKPRRGRAKAPLAALSALLMLAGAVQVLAPASAAALTNQAGCRNVLDLGYIEVCLDDENGGGSEGGGETITITDTKPDVNPCIANPSACLPRQPSSGRSPVPAERSPTPTRSGGGRAGRHAEADKQTACMAVNLKLTAMNAADVLRYHQQLEQWRQDHNPYFLEKPWLEKRYPQVVKLLVQKQAVCPLS
jgi:hypothetical protein